MHCWALPKDFSEVSTTNMDDMFAINLAKSRFREGFCRADEEMVLSVYDRAFCDMSFGLPSFYNSDAREVFRARLQRLFRDYIAEMAVLITKIVMYGDTAYDRGSHVLKLTDRQCGSRHEVRTRYLETWRRDATRGWVITSFIDNLDETPKMPEDVIWEMQNTTSRARVTRLPENDLQFS